MKYILAGILLTGFGLAAASATQVATVEERFVTVLEPNSNIDSVPVVAARGDRPAP